MTVVGAIALPSLPPERLPAVARAADASGLAELWLWEDSFFAGGIAATGALLAGTERLKVAVSPPPVPLRAVPLLAMELAALERLAPGRLVPALGHGVQEWMGQAGVRVELPPTLLRACTEGRRGRLRGR